MPGENAKKNRQEKEERHRSECDRAIANELLVAHGLLGRHACCSSILHLIQHVIQPLGHVVLNHRHSLAMLAGVLVGAGAVETGAAAFATAQGLEIDGHGLELKKGPDFSGPSRLNFTNKVLGMT